MKKYVVHLRQVFVAFQANQLYVKKEKCEFGLHKVSFLGHIMTERKDLNVLQKIKAIVYWEAPTSPIEL